MAATSTSSLSSQPLTFILKPKPPHSIINIHNLYPLPLTPPLTLSTIHSSKRTIHFQNPPHVIPQKTTHQWRISAVPEDIVPSNTITPLENTEQIISATNDDGVSTIISTLLFIAFIGLSVLTIGVIYIAVTDFLQKREGEKFDKEEAAKKKKGGRKGKARVRAGPKGFGQKIVVDDDFGDD